MATSLADLTTPRTRAGFKAQLLRGLQGVFFTKRPVGSGTGTVTGSGAPTGSYSVFVKVISTGTLGTATFQVSTDGGASYGSTQTVPSNGTYAVAGTGFNLVFGAGVLNDTSGFVAGDVYSFAVQQSTIPVTSWAPGSTPLTLVECDADVDADLAQLIQAVAMGGLLETASGDWLTLLASNVYGLAKLKGVPTQGVVLLTNGGSGGPYSLAAGALVVSTAGGLRYISTAAMTLAAGVGATVNVAVQAESAGSAYNQGQNVITSMVTTLAGVSCNNPVFSGGTWITQAGTDDEADPALRTRCSNRWGTLGAGTAAALDLLSRSSSSEVTKTFIRASPTVPGQVDVYLAGAAGGVTGPAVTAVQTALNAVAVLTTTVNVVSASSVPITVTATVYVDPAYSGTALAAATTALAAYFTSVGIGGTVWLSEVITSMSAVPGVTHVVVTAPVADTVLTATQVATLISNLTGA